MEEVATYGILFLVNVSSAVVAAYIMHNLLKNQCAALLYKAL